MFTLPWEDMEGVAELRSVFGISCLLGPKADCP